ncbi:MAG TPA: HEAT repeat domain-containing protein [Candidatus Nanopelagicales bacterium]|nr:HEAT repeat domain-containing protein [Candidatus Nanopelagicales bacterium]
MNTLDLPSPPAYVLEYRPSPAQGELARTISRIERGVFIAQHEARPAPPPFDDLPPPVAQLVASRWKEPCEGAFEYLAAHHPRHLLRLIQGGKLEHADLTFAAEIAGRLRDEGAVQRALLPLLSHPEAVVREGAIYGLSRHLNASVRERFAELAAKDPSAAVRSAAADALDDP